MSKPQLRAVHDDQLHARDLARQAVKRWRSDAERRGYPTTNIHDGKGARVLDRDAVLNHDAHDRRLGRK